MQYFTVSIPVKTYVKKYIEVRYPTPLILSLSNYLGCVIHAYLSKKTSPIIRHKPNMASQQYRNYSDNIKINIPSNLIFQHKTGFNISFADAFLINNLFEEKIAEDLHSWCTVYKKAGYSHRQAIENFCDDHNIDIDRDISYSAFKKSEYRHRKTLQKAPANLSPTLFT